MNSYEITGKDKDDFFPALTGTFPGETIQKAKKLAKEYFAGELHTTEKNIEILSAIKK
jgi:hypothetical protein